jgi:hypothetical protein
MFSKHVWFDRKHQAEVFITDEGVISGTIVAYQGAVCLINPRPEILTALYSEAKIKRILSIKAVILTDNTMEYTRGLCALVAYSRGLRRRTPLTVITRNDTAISRDFLNSCCSQLLNDSHFDVTVESVEVGEPHELGVGRILYERVPGSETNPYLVMSTGKRTLHYFDETHRGPFDDTHASRLSRPNVVIRAAGLLASPARIIERVPAAV